MTLDLNTCTLIIDKSAPTRKSTKNMLKTIGFNQIFETSNCTETLTLLKKQIEEKRSIGLIILPFSLEDGDGIELTKTIRNFSKVKIIMTTPEPDQERILNGANAGVSSFIVTPFSAVDLNNKIKQIFK